MEVSTPILVDYMFFIILIIIKIADKTKSAKNTMVLIYLFMRDLGQGTLESNYLEVLPAHMFFHPCMI